MKSNFLPSRFVPTYSFLACLLVSASFGWSAIEAGSEPKEWPANPAKHVVSIKRISSDETGAKLIAAAEGLMHDGIEPEPKGEGEPRPGAPPKGQWWEKEELGIKIPFAITSDAVTYYSNLIATYGKQAAKRYSEPNSSFVYEAKVEKHPAFEIEGKSFKDVSVVTLRIQFRQNFAASVTEGLSFEKTRTVVFDRDGKVVHVSGDGPTEVAILAI